VVAAAATAAVKQDDEVVIVTPRRNRLADVLSSPSPQAVRAPVAVAAPVLLPSSIAALMAAPRAASRQQKMKPAFPFTAAVGTSVPDAFMTSPLASSLRSHSSSASAKRRRQAKCVSPAVQCFSSSLSSIAALTRGAMSAPRHAPIGLVDDSLAAAFVTASQLTPRASTARLQAYTSDGVALCGRLAPPSSASANGTGPQLSSANRRDLAAATVRCRPMPSSRQSAAPFLSNALLGSQ
jgi:hypothetical protein